MRPTVSTPFTCKRITVTTRIATIDVSRPPGIFGSIFLSAINATRLPIPIAAVARFACGASEIRLQVFSKKFPFGAAMARNFGICPRIVTHTSP